MEFGDSQKLKYVSHQPEKVNLSDSSVCAKTKEDLTLGNQCHTIKIKGCRVGDLNTESYFFASFLKSIIQRDGSLPFAFQRYVATELNMQHMDFINRNSETARTGFSPFKHKIVSKVTNFQSILSLYNFTTKIRSVTGHFSLSKTGLMVALTFFFIVLC